MKGAASETNHPIPEQIAHTQELQTKPCHSNPSGAKTEAGVPPVVRQSTAEAHMSAEHERERAEANGAEAAGKLTAASGEKGSEPPALTPTEEEPPELRQLRLKTMFYWMLSRL